MKKFYREKVAVRKEKAGNPAGGSKKSKTDNAKEREVSAKRIASASEEVRQGGGE